MPDTDLLRARYVTHTFGRHTHSGYAIGVITDGLEAFDYRGGFHQAGGGQIVVIEPDRVHTGSAGGPAGWAYRMFYPEPAVVAAVAAEVTGVRGTPSFPRAIMDDPATAGVLAAAHRAAYETADPLAATTLFLQAIAMLVSRHGSPGRGRSARPRPAVVSQVQELLADQLVDPPALDELARRVGMSQYALVRTFRASTGLPPHRWLVQQRVTKARALLDAGEVPAAAAAATGFADQAHLTRHFKQFVGVTPGAYRSERLSKNVQEIRCQRS
ncbi:AraC family transcriptional regulator [Fodinicola feengrottensis]|uniref:AraC family transcriptional regulator n=1 Tax=Fodinicola feengrottensis TaxID=435914 RepID=UPI0013D5F641|nr:AraC family transcriptional regulator [Fodinicola feengrottensis]